MQQAWQLFVNSTAREAACICYTLATGFALWLGATSARCPHPPALNSTHAHSPHPPARPLQVALDIASAYQQQLASLPGLSAQGAAQLAADLEYFTNVLSTLGVAVPPSLAAWQAATAAPPEGLSAVAEAAVEGGDASTQAAVQLVARMRGIALPVPLQARPSA